MKTSRIAVIDIGSNSVRLVVYDALKRAPLLLLNEKVLCGLARDMELTSALNVQGAEQALQALGRFSYLVKAMQVKDLHVFATSAVRDATDGNDFIEKIRKAFNFHVAVLPGEQEAKLAALGVISSLESADGVIGDMGGGSLELAQVLYQPGDRKKDFDAFITDQKSFPIGALRLRNRAKNNVARARRIVEKYLQSYELESRLKGRSFYAVGGGFRALAKCHMHYSHYPLRVLHEYRIPAKKMLETAQKMAAMPVRKLAQLEPVSSDRADTIAFTAAVMEQIIHIGQPKYIVCSTHGVREGMLFEQLPKPIRHKDPLLEAASEVIRSIAPYNDGDWVTFGEELCAWMDPMFRNETPAVRRLRLAACIMSQLAWHEHKAYQSEMAFRWIIDATLPGIDHQGRVFVGTCLFHRYQERASRAVLWPAQTLLGRQMIYRAQVIGAAMRLGYQLCGGVPGVLQKTPLAFDLAKGIELTARQEASILLSADVERELNKLGTLTQLKTKVQSRGAQKL